LELGANLPRRATPDVSPPFERQNASRRLLSVPPCSRS